MTESLIERRPIGAEEFRQWSRINDFVNRFSYKPGWQFVLQDFRWDRMDNLVRLDVSARVQDVMNPEKTILIGETVTFPMTEQEDIISYRLLALVNSMERHEIEEWLRFDGIPVRNPHPERLSDQNPVADYLASRMKS